MRWRSRLIVASQTGLTLIEVVIVLALVALVIPFALRGLSALTGHTDRHYDRSVMFELAQSQLEYVESQPYSEAAAGYALVAAPTGYSIQVQTGIAVTYTYAAPSSTPTQETLQLNTVTVNSLYDTLAVSRYRVRK